MTTYTATASSPGPAPQVIITRDDRQGPALMIIPLGGATGDEAAQVAIETLADLAGSTPSLIAPATWQAASTLEPDETPAAGQTSSPTRDEVAETSATSATWARPPMSPANAAATWRHWMARQATLRATGRATQAAQEVATARAGRTWPQVIDGLGLTETQALAAIDGLEVADVARQARPQLH